MACNNATFVDFVCFLKGEEDSEHEEVDWACLSHEHFNNANSQKTVLPLYFFLTREKERKMTVAQMKKSFRCGAEIIQKVRKAIVEKKPLPTPVTRRGIRCEMTPL